MAPYSLPPAAKLAHSPLPRKCALHKAETVRARASAEWHPWWRFCHMAARRGSVSCRASAQASAALQPTTRDLGGDELRRVERRVAPCLQLLQPLGKRTRRSVPAQRRMEAAELGRPAPRLEHV